jgi:hypothetical protein
VFCCVCPRSVSYVRCCLCLWIAHFFLTFSWYIFFDT